MNSIVKFNFPEFIHIDIPKNTPFCIKINQREAKASHKIHPDGYLQLINEIFLRRPFHDLVLTRSDCAGFTRLIVDIDWFDTEQKQNSIVDEAAWIENAITVVNDVTKHLNNLFKINTTPLLLSKGKGFGFHIYTSLFLDFHSMQCLIFLLHQYMGETSTYLVDRQIVSCSLPLSLYHTTIFEFNEGIIKPFKWNTVGGLALDPLLFREGQDSLWTALIPTKDETNYAYKFDEEFYKDSERPFHLYSITTPINLVQTREKKSLPGVFYTVKPHNEMECEGEQSHEKMVNDCGILPPHEFKLHYERHLYRKPSIWPVNIFFARETSDQFLDSFETYWQKLVNETIVPEQVKDFEKRDLTLFHYKLPDKEKVTPPNDVLINTFYQRIYAYLNLNHQYEFLSNLVARITENDSYLNNHRDCIAEMLRCAFDRDDVSATLAFCVQALDPVIKLPVIVYILMNITKNSRARQILYLYHLMYSRKQTQEERELIIRDLVAHFYDNYDSHNLFYILSLLFLEKRHSDSRTFITDADKSEFEDLFEGDVETIFTEHIFMTYRNGAGCFSFINGKYIAVEEPKYGKIRIYKPHSRLQNCYRVGTTVYSAILNLFEFNGPALNSLIYINPDQLQIDRRLQYSTFAGQQQRTMYYFLHYMWPFRRMLEYQKTFVLLIAPLFKSKLGQLNSFCPEITLSRVDLTNTKTCLFHPWTFTKMPSNFDNFSFISLFLQLHLLINYYSHKARLPPSPLEFVSLLLGSGQPISGFKEKKKEGTHLQKGSGSDGGIILENFDGKSDDKDGDKFYNLFQRHLFQKLNDIKNVIFVDGEDTVKEPMDTCTDGDDNLQVCVYFKRGFSTDTRTSPSRIFQSISDPSALRLRLPKTIQLFLESDAWTDEVNKLSEIEKNLNINTIFNRTIAPLEYSFAVFSIILRNGRDSIFLHGPSVEPESWAGKLRANQVSLFESFQKYLKDQVYEAPPLKIDSMNDFGKIFYDFCRRQKKDEFEDMFDDPEDPTKLKYQKEATLADQTLTDLFIAVAFMEFFCMADLNPDQLLIIAIFITEALNCGNRTRRFLYLGGPSGSGKSHLMRTAASLMPTDTPSRLKQHQLVQSQATQFWDGFYYLTQNLFVYTEEFDNLSHSAQREFKEVMDMAEMSVTKKNQNQITNGVIVACVAAASDQLPQLEHSMATATRHLPIFRENIFCGLTRDRQMTQKVDAEKQSFLDSVEPYIGLMLIRKQLITSQINSSKSLLLYLFRFLFMDMLRHKFNEPIHPFKTVYAQTQVDKYTTMAVALIKFQKDFIIEYSDQPVDLVYINGVIQAWALKNSVKERNLNEIRALFHAFVSAERPSDYYVKLTPRSQN